MKAQYQRSLVLGAALVGLLITGPAVYATGVQCERATGDVEKAICADPVLLKLDQALGVQYDLAVASDPQVKDRQLYWLQHTLAQCQDKQCLVVAYKGQIAALGGNWEQVKQNVMTDAGRAQQAPQAQPQVQPAANTAAARYAEADRQQQIMSQRAREERAQREAQESKTANKYILIWIVALVLAGAGWHLFIRNRCPHCKSTKYRRVSAEEVDRWRGTKQVTERMASGRDKTRNVQTTFVMMRFAYQCNACQGEWEKERDEEKNKGSWLGRLLTGY